jgi:hypothetical protein
MILITLEIEFIVLNKKSERKRYKKIFKYLKLMSPKKNLQNWQLIEFLKIFLQSMVQKLNLKLEKKKVNNNNNKRNN